jgi:hypothetical protein
MSKNGKSTMFDVQEKERVYKAKREGTRIEVLKKPLSPTQTPKIHGIFCMALGFEKPNLALTFW